MALLPLETKLFAIFGKGARWTGAAAVAVALAAGGCGGSSRHVVPARVLDNAFSHPIPTSDMSTQVQLRVDGIKALSAPIALTLRGPYVSGKGKTIPGVDWKMTAALGGVSVPARVVSTRRDVFVSLLGTTYAVGAGAIAAQNSKVAAATRAAGGHPKPLANLGLHPRRWFAAGRDAGDERVAGVKTTHIASLVDPVAVIEDLHAVAARLGFTPSGHPPKKLSAAGRAQVRRNLRNGHIDVWVGKRDGIVRRMRASLDFSVAPAQRASVAGARSGSFAFAMDFAKVGARQTITPLRAQRPIAELIARARSTIRQLLPRR